MSIQSAPMWRVVVKAGRVFSGENARDPRWA
jgi:hypothetical protein